MLNKITATIVATFLIVGVIVAATAQTVTPLPSVQWGSGGSSGGSGTVILPTVDTHAALIARRVTDYPHGVWRTHYSTNGINDGPEFFTPLNGTCASNGLVNDGGNCANEASGNSFKGILNGEYNVRLFGAVGDSITDDTVAIQAATNAAAAATSAGIVLFTPGTGLYCVKTGPITNSVRDVRFIGVDRNITLSACGADVSIFSLTGFHNKIEHLGIDGSKTLDGTHDAVTFGSGCAECTLDDVIAVGGRHTFAAINSGEIWILGSSKLLKAYGSSIIYLTGAGGYIWRAKVDQVWPGGVPSSGATLPSAWASLTPYSTGDIAIVGNYRIQSTSGGTSGSSPPTLLPYEQNITDGSVTWQLVGQATDYFAIQCDTGCGGDLIVALTDMTGSFTTSFAMTNTLSGTAPAGIMLTNNTISQAEGGVSLRAGSAFYMTGGRNSCQFATCNVIETTAAWNGDASVTGAEIGPAISGVGVHLGASGRNNFTGNVFKQSDIGIEVAANIGTFTATGNDFSHTLTTALDVLAGTSNNYVFNNNILGSAVISDLGTGTSKTVQKVTASGFDSKQTFDGGIVANGTTTVPPITVNAPSSGATATYVGGSNPVQVNIDSDDAAYLLFRDNGTNKFELVKSAANVMSLYDNVNAFDAWKVSTTGTLTLGESSQIVIPKTTAAVLGNIASGAVPQVIVSSSGANDTQATLDVGTAGQAGYWLFKDGAGGSKFQVGKSATNSFIIFDHAQGANALSITSAGVMTIGETSSTLTIPSTITQFGSGSGAPGHLASGQTTAPALTSCGGGSPAIIGTDTAGTVTMGTTATGCIITFNVAYTAAPHCVVTWKADPLASQSYAVSTTALTLTQTSTSSNVANYICIGRNGG